MTNNPEIMIKVENLAFRTNDQKKGYGHVNYVYHSEYVEGDKIKIEVAKCPCFIWIQLDVSLKPTLVYLKNTSLEFPIPFARSILNSYSPTAFQGDCHYMSAKYATDEELTITRNLSENSHDYRENEIFYPHARANVETRDDGTFFAKNAIDGILANESHGSYPYQSWGINQQEDAEWILEFGREVIINKIGFLLRCDFPHDSYWIQATVEFSDGEEQIIMLKKDFDIQFKEFNQYRTTSVKLKNLIKNNDDSPFPALTQLIVFGNENLDEEKRKNIGNV